ncbi:MarR family winged helix-turn-helix transcriptional regulator [Marisediminicola senii]|uniref:MarR family winged helix-turn-helix transcriptional regulator n=1 Tax=Marisediminicola senii TaxID=2711233 RepID=UPI0013EAC984|nr:MarR family transcriptional regulator [Marisediminicola senii]
MTAPDDSAPSAVTYELSRELRIAVNRLSRRLRAEKADHDLTDGQTTVLGIIELTGPRTLTELSEIERVTPPSMSRTVTALLEAGYIERQPSDDDGRKVLLSLTANGHTLVLETRRRRDEWLYTRLATMTEAERRTLADAASILRRLSDE